MWHWDMSMSQCNYSLGWKKSDSYIQLLVKSCKFSLHMSWAHFNQTIFLISSKIVWASRLKPSNNKRKALKKAQNYSNYFMSHPPIIYFLHLSMLLVKICTAWIFSPITHIFSKAFWKKDESYFWTVIVHCVQCVKTHLFLSNWCSFAALKT